ncbi:TPA: hypothetical protein LA742_002248 [Clostridium botulinum]|uniref:hypothetical protein n=1 Tax=Clostridium sporogenes TaxID=1509 RepID=UPI0007744BE6|nr:hypothetical protein [Clostridium sporogenes]AUM93859.1 hypothetical protein RSJ11_01250 [Clostridium sporogenes]HBJ2613774.1 hypothetical protein [Clostridium botulinum]
MDKDTILKIMTYLDDENNKRKEEIYKLMGDENYPIERIRELQLKNCGIGIARDIVQSLYRSLPLLEIHKQNI